MEPKKLYRIEQGKMLFGVCNGIAAYLNMDVTIIRLLAVALAVCSGAGIVLYILAAIIMHAGAGILTIIRNKFAASSCHSRTDLLQ